MWTSWPTATACCCLLPPFGVAVSDDREPEDGLAGRHRVRDLPARRLADVAAWVDDEHGVGQVDLPEVEFVEKRLLGLGDRVSSVLEDGGCQNEGAREGEPARVGFWD